MIKSIVSKKRFGLLAMVTLLVTMIASNAFAYTDPAQTDLLYDVYDILINELLGGPIGFTMAACMFLGGILMLVFGKGLLMAFICVAGGVVLYKADSVVKSFGVSLDAVQSMANQAATVVPQVTQFLF